MSREGDIRSLARQLEKAADLVHQLAATTEAVCDEYDIESAGVLQRINRAADNMMSAFDRFNDLTQREDATLRDLS